MVGKSAPGYNQILRGMPRDSGTLHSANINKGSLSINGGAHGKMLSKASNGNPIRAGSDENNSNGYLLKSAQKTVKQLHHQQ